MKAHLQSRILVVDDERSVTGALELILHESGHEVVTAHSVVQAMKALSDFHFDLVITDFRLSDATGIDLITHIKKENPVTEVILMTAYG